jgi:hypothetical protein
MAADVRTRLDLLLEERVMLVAKQAEAASNHSDEYAGYATLLTANAGSLADVVYSGFGNSAATGLALAWGMQTEYLIDYTIGLVTHNPAKTATAWAGLLNGFVPKFAQIVANLTKLPLDQVTQLETGQVTGTKAIIDDLISRTYPRMYVDLRATYADTSRLGDMVATRMVHMFPDKFPGDPSDRSVDQRVSINGLLQEHAYLVTMFSDAVIGGRGPDATAATGAVNANGRAIEQALAGYIAGGASPTFNALWEMRDAELLAYATSADPLAQNWLTDTFGPRFSSMLHADAGNVRDQVLATLMVIDDRRAGSLAGIARDDQAAAAAMQPIADSIA